MKTKHHEKKSKALLISDLKSSQKQRKKSKENNNINEKINKIDEKKCYLIQINANNSLNNKPPESKIILDNYSYEEAIKFEKRHCCLIYFIIFLGKENILNIFFLNSPF